jgi:hypothetical protein
MAESKDILQALRNLGIKSAKFGFGNGSFSFQLDNFSVNLTEVEFFPQPYPTISPLDLDTLVPPPPAPGEETPDVKVPSAIARILGKGSVS